MISSQKNGEKELQTQGTVIVDSILTWASGAAIINVKLFDKKLASSPILRIAVQYPFCSFDLLANNINIVPYFLEF